MEALKNKISKYKKDTPFSYLYSFEPTPFVIDSIKLDEIGTVNQLKERSKNG